MLKHFSGITNQPTAEELIEGPVLKVKPFYTSEHFKPLYSGSLRILQTSYNHLQDLKPGTTARDLTPRPCI